jgi:hypothetical protein
LHISGHKPETPPPDEYQLKERPKSNLKIMMGGAPTTTTMMTQYKYPQGNPNIVNSSKRQQPSGINGPSPMKLKILP